MQIRILTYILMLVSFAVGAHGSTTVFDAISSSPTTGYDIDPVTHSFVAQDFTTSGTGSAVLEQVTVDFSSLSASMDTWWVGIRPDDGGYPSSTASVGYLNPSAENGLSITFTGSLALSYNQAYWIIVGNSSLQDAVVGTVSGGTTAIGSWAPAESFVASHRDNSNFATDGWTLIPSSTLSMTLAVVSVPEPSTSGIAMAAAMGIAVVLQSAFRRRTSTRLISSERL
jgi:hypothetical protein